MKTIAIIIRGKHSQSHNPDLMDQHADVLLSTGQPYGYFGYGGLSPTFGFWMNGIVFDFERFKSNRAHFVDSQIARKANVVSTICMISVREDIARRFDEYWMKLRLATMKGEDGFSMLGNNCSSHAARAFKYAGILIDDEIPGLDTPQNLFLALRNRMTGNFTCQSGYLGIEKKFSRFQITVER